MPFISHVARLCSFKKPSCGQKIAHFSHHADPSQQVYLLENGTDLPYIQQLLGHASTKTTEIYIGMTKQGGGKPRSPLEDLDLP